MSPRGKEFNEKKRAEAKGRIAKAALKVFAEYGYHGATMEHIMRVSGLSKGLVYLYFPSKERMFFHIVELALAVSKNIWDEGLNAPGTAWQKIEKLSEVLFENAFTDENSLYFLIMLQATTQGKGIPGLFEYIVEHGAHYNLLPSLVREAQNSGEAAPGDPDVLASTYLAVVQGYTIILLHDKDLQKKIAPETFTDVLRNRGENK